MEHPLVNLAICSSSGFSCLFALPLSIGKGWRSVVAFPGFFPLQKHAYSNILKILQPRKESFQIKKSDIFIFLLKK